MPEATLKVVAKLAGVAPTTVSRVLNDVENVAPATREKILAVMRDLDYTPNVHAASLRRKRSADESATVARDHVAPGPEPFKHELSIHRKMPHPGEEVLHSDPEEGKALAQQIIWLLHGSIS